MAWHAPQESQVKTLAGKHEAAAHGTRSVVFAQRVTSAASFGELDKTKWFERLTHLPGENEYRANTRVIFPASLFWFNAMFKLAFCVAGLGGRQCLGIESGGLPRGRAQFRWRVLRSLFLPRLLAKPNFQSYKSPAFHRELRCSVPPSSSNWGFPPVEWVVELE